MTRYGGNMYMEGRLAANGTRYAYIEVGESSGFVPLSMIETDEKAARALLCSQGVFLGTAWNQVRAELPGLKTSKSAAIADRVGWHNGSFVLRDDEIISPRDAPKLDVMLNQRRGSFATLGSLEGWISGVAEPLTGQKLPMVMFMTVLAGCLLEITGRRDNFGYELVGKPGSGKSTIIDWAASIFGYPRAVSLNTTLDAIELLLPRTNGLSMVFDELNLFYGDASPQVRASKLRRALLSPWWRRCEAPTNRRQRRRAAPFHGSSLS